MGDKPREDPNDSLEQSEVLRRIMENRADRQNDELISRRERERRERGEPNRAQLWRESERRFEAARRQPLAADWGRWHREMAAPHHATLRRLIRWHERQAENMEARRKRRERERAAGLALSQTLRERLEAGRIPIEALVEPGPSPNETGSTNPKGGDGAA